MSNVKLKLSHVNKSLQKLQNMKLSKAFNQHVQPYAQRDSSDVLYRQSNVFRSIHRKRRLHLLQLAFTLKSNAALLDERDIPQSNHCKFPRNPYYRCMTEWNNLQVLVTFLPNRDVFKNTRQVFQIHILRY